MSVDFVELRTRRKELGLTQKQVAKAIGLSRAGYSAIERGRHPGSIETRQKLAEVLGLKCEDIQDPKSRHAKGHAAPKKRRTVRKEPCPQPKAARITLKKYTRYCLGEKNMVYLYDEAGIHVFAELPSGILRGYTSRQLGLEESA